MEIIIIFLGYLGGMVFTGRWNSNISIGVEWMDLVKKSLISLVKD